MVLIASCTVSASKSQKEAQNCNMQLSWPGSSFSWIILPYPVPGLVSSDRPPSISHLRSSANPALHCERLLVCRNTSVVSKRHNNSNRSLWGRSGKGGPAARKSGCAAHPPCGCQSSQEADADGVQCRHCYACSCSCTPCASPGACRSPPPPLPLGACGTDWRQGYFAEKRAKTPMPKPNNKALDWP